MPLCDDSKWLDCHVNDAKGHASIFELRNYLPFQHRNLDYIHGLSMDLFRPQNHLFQNSEERPSPYCCYALASV